MIITPESDNITVKGHRGTFYVVDSLEWHTDTYYLCESEWYGDDAAWICIREDGSLLCDNINNGVEDVREYLEEYGGHEDEY